MSDKKYLYYSNKWHGLQRVRIVRETPAYYFVRFGMSGEDKISKKHLTTGTCKNRTHYKEETPELKAKYEKEAVFEEMIRKFHNKLDALRYVTDLETIRKVMEIEVEQ